MNKNNIGLSKSDLEKILAEAKKNRKLRENIWGRNSKKITSKFLNNKMHKKSVGTPGEGVTEKIKIK